MSWSRTGGAPAGGSVAARCQALGLARSSFYYQSKAETALNLLLMRLLDEEFTRHNFKGVRGLRDHRRLAGYLFNEKRVRLMGHEPVYPKPRLSRCIVPGCDGVPFGRATQQKLWDNYFTAAPAQLRQYDAVSNVVRKASKR